MILVRYTSKGTALNWSYIPVEGGGSWQELTGGGPTFGFIISVLLWSSAQRVGFFNIRSGRVLDKIPGSGWGFGSGRSVEKYDQVFPGIFFSFGYFRVFQVFRVFPGMSGIFGYFWVYPYILRLRLFSNIYWGLKRLQQNQTGLDKSMSWSGS